MPVSDLAERFAENLSRYHEQSGLTQEELASRAEIHRTQVGLLLNGKRAPRLDTLIKLAGALRVSPCDLIQGITWEPASSSTGKFKLSASGQRKK
jgi:transcriptional regulator with XRE-family HTH domain